MMIRIIFSIGILLTLVTYFFITTDILEPTCPLRIIAGTKICNI